MSQILVIDATIVKALITLIISSLFLINFPGDWSKANGILGSVIREEFDLAPASWTRTPERVNWTDLTINMFDRQLIIMFNLKETPVDWMLFLRPFTEMSWGGVWIVFSFTAAVLRIVYIITKR